MNDITKKEWLTIRRALSDRVNKLLDEIGKTETINKAYSPIYLTELHNELEQTTTLLRKLRARAPKYPIIWNARDKAHQ